MTTRTAGFVASGTEVLVGVRQVAADGGRGEFTLPTGPHLADPQIGQVRSALAIALDDATGYLVVDASRPGQWPVSLNIRVDFLADLPTAPGEVRVSSELIACTETGGTSRAVATGPSGEVIALATQRSHLIDSGGPDRAVLAAASWPPAPTRPLRESLAMTTCGPGEVVMAPTVWAANVMGNVHGGVSFVGVELAAHSAAGPGHTTMSIDLTYLRPGDATTATTFRAQSLHRGRSTAVLEVESVRADGRSGVVGTVILQR